MRRYFADKTCINLIRLVLLLVTALLDALAYYFIPVAPTCPPCRLCCGW